MTTPMNTTKVNPDVLNQFIAEYRVQADQYDALAAHFKNIAQAWIQDAQMFFSGGINYDNALDFNDETKQYMWKEPDLIWFNGDTEPRKDHGTYVPPLLNTAAELYFGKLEHMATACTKFAEQLRNDCDHLEKYANDLLAAEADAANAFRQE